MSSDCPEIRSRLRELCEDVLPESERRSVRGHLAACLDCRREVRAADPLQAFARFGSEEISESEASQVLEGVRHAISLRRAESRLKVRRWRGASPRAAAATAAAIVAVLLLPGGPASAPPEPAFAARVSSPEPAAPAMAPARSSSESLDSGATVYDWNPGGGEPRVVWIVDRSLDI